MNWLPIHGRTGQSRGVNADGSTKMQDRTDKKESPTLSGISYLNVRKLFFHSKQWLNYQRIQENQMHANLAKFIKDLYANMVDKKIIAKTAKAVRFVSMAANEVNEKIV